MLKSKFMFLLNFFHFFDTLFLLAKSGKRNTDIENITCLPNYYKARVKEFKDYIYKRYDLA